MIVAVIILSLVVGPTPIDSLRATGMPCPEFIIEAAEAYLETNLGPEGYARGASFVSWRHVSGKPGCVSWHPIADEDRYVLTWEVNVEGKEVESITVDLNISEDGRRVASGPWRCLPNCADNPAKCRFPIGKEEAKKIARSAQLLRGVGEWRFGFFWDRDLGTYVWNVSNTLEEYERGSFGRSVLIDANTGEVLDLKSFEEIRM